MDTLITVSPDHTRGHTTLVTTSLDKEIDPPQGQHIIFTTNIHASDGMRTCNPWNRAATGLRFRSRGYRDRLQFYSSIFQYQSTYAYRTALYLFFYLPVPKYVRVPYRTAPYLFFYLPVPKYVRVPYRTVPYRTAPYRTVPHRTVPYRTVLTPCTSQWPYEKKTHFLTDPISKSTQTFYFQGTLIEHIPYIQAKPTRCNVTQWYLLL